MVLPQRTQSSSTEFRRAEQVETMNSERFNEVANKYQELQTKSCDILGETDGKQLFSTEKWEKDIGSGITRVLQNGAHIEKAALNFSKVSGKYTDRMGQMAGREGTEFSATGISSIIHPYNPFVPIIHMNVRYFELDTGICWFGGGIDLTPHYINEDEALNFHKRLKMTCDKFDISFYGRFKKWADDYFFLPHRNETRGVGGIFFDQLVPGQELGFEKLFEFTQELGFLYPYIYQDILHRKKNKPFSNEHKNWQMLRRGRYVEFNLVYDRGTRFGLESNGNTESILLSMPPMANWTYNHAPEEGSEEHYTQQMLKKGIDWLRLTTRSFATS